jgi:hypothetical protein
LQFLARRHAIIQAGTGITDDGQQCSPFGRIFPDHCGTLLLTIYQSEFRHLDLSF